VNNPFHLRCGSGHSAREHGAHAVGAEDLPDRHVVVLDVVGDECAHGIEITTLAGLDERSDDVSG